MGRYIGPKFKLDRREGQNLFLKGRRSMSGKHPIDKKGVIPPGQHGPKSLRRRKTSDFGLQLREKQKVKRMYGVMEKQFKKYFNEASKEKGNTGVALMQTLETRLDNIVYKLALAPSRTSARQLVSHGHVKVNDKKVNIPSYNIRVGDIVSLSEKAQKFALIKEALELRGEDTPDWLNRKALVGKVEKYPSSDELETIANEQLIVEYYSR